jgi:hypothetical protein
VLLLKPPARYQRTSLCQVPKELSAQIFVRNLGSYRLDVMVACRCASSTFPNAPESVSRSFPSLFHDSRSRLKVQFFMFHITSPRAGFPSDNLGLVLQSSVVIDTGLLSGRTLVLLRIQMFRNTGPVQLWGLYPGTKTQAKSFLILLCKDAERLASRPLHQM